MKSEILNIVENDAVLVAIENITIIIIPKYHPPYLLFNNTPLSENTTLILYENFNDFLSKSSINQMFNEKKLIEKNNKNDENDLKIEEYRFEKLKSISNPVIFSEYFPFYEGLQIFSNDLEIGKYLNLILMYIVLLSRIYKCNRYYVINFRN